MKKIISFLLALALLAGALSVFCGCDGNGNDGKLSVVTTIFPIYDWAREIIGEENKNVDLTLLLDNGVDLHNYQPSADDIVKVASCDVFIHVGGHSDEWVADVLAQATNEDMVVINLIAVLGDAVKEEEIVDGMEHEHEEGEEHDHEHNDGAHANENDEHVWLSLRNAKAACRKIAEALCAIDSENAESYAANVKDYCDELDALDNEYKTATEAASTRTLLFGDRFPFRYLTDDYGLEYYAAFSGCSAESEASFETIAFLAGKMDELNLTSVIIIEGSDGSIAQTIINTTAAKNARVLTLNSMQTTTLADAKNGVTYLSIMEANLVVLQEAFG